MDTIIKKKVEKLVLSNQEQQKSQEWFEKRWNMVTASDIAAIFEEHPFMTKKQLLVNKCEPLKIETNSYLEWGNIFEKVALDLYKKLCVVSNVYEVGCIQHPTYNFLGASPDGILSTGKLLEIKCPKTRKISNDVPRYYWIQMQIQMEVCNLNECDFFQCEFEQYDNETEYMNDKSTITKGYIKHQNIYWRLNKHTLVNVKRDTRWFIKNIGTIQKFWKSVLYYRKVGIENFDDRKSEYYQIRDWNDWIPASQVKNYLLNDTCLDYLQILRQSNFMYEESNTKTKSINDFLQDNIDYGSSFIELICNQGKRFEREVVRLLINRFDIKIVCTDSTQARSAMKFKETVTHMRNGVPIIYQGVLHGHDSKTYGVPDLLVRSDYVNKLIETPVYGVKDMFQGSYFDDNYHYVIVDIKFTTLRLCSDGIHLLNTGMLKANKGQLWIYNNILDEVQDYNPNKAFILGKKWRYTSNGNTYSNDTCFDRLGTINYSNNDLEYVEKTNQAIEWCRELRQNFDKFTLFPPNDVRLYPNMTNVYDHPYHGMKEKLAEQIHDITQIWYCSNIHRENAFCKKVYNWKNVNCNIETLGITGEWKAPRIQAILDINQQTSDLIRCENFMNIENWKEERWNDLFVDFETVNINEFTKTDNDILSVDESIIVIIGCGWVENGKWRFRKFTADVISVDTQAQIVNEFMVFISDFYKSNLNPRVFHWGHVERTIMNKLRGTGLFYMYDNWMNMEIHWVDLCKIVQEEMIVFQGALTYNLKKVSKALYNHGMIKTCWMNVSKCANGLDAMVSMLNCNDIAKSKNISLKQMPVIQDIEKYNEIDCKVMWEILMVMRENINEVKSLTELKH